MVTNNNFDKCPKCGYRNIYVGATKIECGYDSNCENFTVNQAKEVAKILKFGERKDKEKQQDPQMALDLDWDEDEIITRPITPLYFSTTSD